MAGLQSASERLRQATFELHPAVLEQVGLGPAVKQLAASTAQRSGIKISTDIDYPIRSGIDPIVFGVVRELLSNVVRHSGATTASVRLGITDEKCVLDVADDGVGSPVTLWRAAWVRTHRSGFASGSGGCRRVLVFLATPGDPCLRGTTTETVNGRCCRSTDVPVAAT